MSAASYYDAHPNAPRPLKPMLLADSLSTQSGHSGAKYDSLLHADGSHEALVQQHDEIFGRIQARDKKLKYRIRVLKVLSRFLSLILSLATLAPLSLTLQKFLSTRDVLIPVNGVPRTAWSASPKTWPMYMYITLAAISTVLNLIILLAYLRSIRQANRASAVASVFESVVLVGHVAIWAAGAALYRVGKDEGEHARDLWGWTCSLGAAKIQNEFSKEINFGRYCNIQVSACVGSAMRKIIGRRQL
ncbi:MAG: hypothetical protein M1822_007241 [Bathelium mastoideum]|nr:MAG: hypothetical protein M1822_007241 [Bathelium mastoideum]